MTIQEDDKSLINHQRRYEICLKDLPRPTQSGRFLFNILFVLTFQTDDPEFTRILRTREVREDRLFHVTFNYALKDSCTFPLYKTSLAHAKECCNYNVKIKC